MNCRFWLILALLLAFSMSMAACGGKPASTSVPEPVNTPAKAQPAVEATQAQAVDNQPVSLARRGPGSFDLMRPSSGLETLTGYSQHYESRFTGRKDGTEHSSETLIHYSLVREPRAEVSSLKTSDQTGAPLEIWAAKFGEAEYLKVDPEAVCQGMASAEAIEAGFIPDPASLLPRVFGAEPAGEESVNGVAALRFNFDEQALPLYPGGKANGSVWTAREGGWVVKYELEVTAPVDVLGMGLEGKQTWLYEVQEAGMLAALALPEDCQPVLLDFPVTPGSHAVERRAGALHYSTSESLEQVSAFYREQLVGAGWQEADIFEPSQQEAALTFLLTSETGQKTASILIEAAGDQVDVTVFVFDEALPGE